MLHDRARRYDVVIIGLGRRRRHRRPGAGAARAPTALRIVVLEAGPKLRDDEFTGREVEMADALYADGGGFLTADGTMTLAFGRAYGGSTVVYTGTSLTSAPSA